MARLITPIPKASWAGSWAESNPIDGFADDEKWPDEVDWTSTHAPNRLRPARHERARLVIS